MTVIWKAKEHIKYVLYRQNNKIHLNSEKGPSPRESPEEKKESRLSLSHTHLLSLD
jgi:hypothetical protein